MAVGAGFAGPTVLDINRLVGGSVPRDAMTARGKGADAAGDGRARITDRFSVSS
jgi:hypothetical protein